LKTGYVLTAALCLANCDHKKRTSPEETLIARVQLSAKTCHDVFGFTPVLNRSASRQPAAWYTRLTEPILAIELGLDDAPHDRLLLDDPSLDEHPDEYLKVKARWMTRAKQPYAKALAACQQLWGGHAEPLKLQKIDTRLSYEFDRSH